MTKKTLRIASLFSGCGGLDLGFTGDFTFDGKYFEKLATEIVFANDSDPEAVAVYNHNRQDGAQSFPIDIRHVSATLIPDFDILLAGFPCQPFSNAGNRKGVHDDNGRGTLFAECERIIQNKVNSGRPPKAFVFENVRGILSSYMHDKVTPVPTEIAKRMEALGYTVSMKLLRASNYGVPQDRYRVFFVGVHRANGAFAFDELDRIVQEEGLASVQAGRLEALLLGHILSHPLISTNDPDNAHWEYTPATQKMIADIGSCAPATEEELSLFDAKTPFAVIPDKFKEGRSWKNIPPEKLTPRFRRIYDNPQRYHSPKFFRRFALGEINGTITASAQPENCGITHPIENRRYTVREIARIQSFPDSFNFSLVKVPSRYKLIGNAVPPVLGWVIAKALLKQI